MRLSARRSSVRFLSKDWKAWALATSLDRSSAARREGRVLVEVARRSTSSSTTSRNLTRMRKMSKKGTVIFGSSGRAQKLTLKDSAHTRILFILRVYLTEFQPDCMVTEIASKICRFLAVAVTRLFEPSYSCFGFIKSYNSGPFCMPHFDDFLISRKS